MGPDAVIIVEEHLGLLGNVNIHGCDYLWKGITGVQNSFAGKFQTYGVNNRIADATTAIDATLGSLQSFWVSNCTFENNFDGVFVDNTVQSFRYGSGNVFKCTSALLHDVNPAVVYAAKSHLGLAIYGRSDKISVNSTFNNLTLVGLYAGGCSNLEVKDAHFDGMESNAMQILGCNATSIKNNFVNNSSNGLIAATSGISVTGNNMFNVEIGISVAAGVSGQKITISGNTIDKVKLIGILAVSVEKASQLVIENNTVKMYGFTIPQGATGLQINGSKTLAFKNSSIRNNTIESSYDNPLVSLVAINSTQGLYFSDNVGLKFLSTGKPKGNGILVTGGSGNTIQNNIVTVDKSSLTNNVVNGYVFENSPTNSVFCNKNVYTPTGVNFVGFNNTTAFKGHTNQNYLTGLLVNSRVSTIAPVIGNQFHNGNLWSGISTNFDANLNTSGFNSSQISQIVDASKFRIKGTIKPLFPDPLLTEPMSGWMNNDVSKNNYVCNIINEEPDPVDDPIKTYIVGGSSYFYSDFPTMNWEAKWEVYKKLLSSTAVLTAQESAFLSNNPNIGVFQSIETQLENGLANLPYSAASLESKLDAISSKSVELDVARTNFENGTISAAQLAVVQSEYDNLVLDFKNMAQANQNATNVLADNLLTLNNAIVPSISNESNLKLVNQIYLSKVIKNIPLTQSDNNSLFSIATLCPYTDGFVVYSARSLYRITYPTQSFDDDSQCSVGTPTPREAVASESKEFFTLTPNPANDIVTISYNLPLEASAGMLELTDAIGNVVFTDKITSNNRQYLLETTNYTSGIYYVKVSGTGIKSETKKLVVLR